MAIIVGSISDLSQSDKGFKFLNTVQDKVDVIGVYVRSQHRNTLDVQKLLKELVQKKVDVIIMGAGWANHLTGCGDAFLRYTLLDDRIVVIGVAFEDAGNPMHTEAALLSITEVPGTQVVFQNENGPFKGREGFFQACKVATEKELPKIKLPEPKPTRDLSLQEALEVASALNS